MGLVTADFLSVIGPITVYSSIRRLCLGLAPEDISTVFILNVAIPELPWPSSLHPLKPGNRSNGLDKVKLNKRTMDTKLYCVTEEIYCKTT